MPWPTISNQWLTNAVTNSAWTWQGNWVAKMGQFYSDKFDTRVADGAGSEVTLKFNGTGVALIGDLSQSGGRADVYLDGAKSELVAEAFTEPKNHDTDLWRIHGLKSGGHTLRLLMRDDADVRSSGKRLTISRAIVYEAK